MVLSKVYDEIEPRIVPGLLFKEEDYNNAKVDTAKPAIYYAYSDMVSIDILTI